MGTLSVRLSDTLQSDFNEAFIKSGLEGKPEFIKLLLKKLNETKPEVQLSQPEPKIIEKEIIREIERSLNENEIKINLTPTQLFALRETVLSPDYISKTNEFVDCVDTGHDPGAIFSKASIYDGIYQGDIFRMEPGTESDEVLKQNIAALLVNVFMVAIINGDCDWIGSPITHKILKTFKKELQLSESKAENSGVWNPENY